MLWPTAMDPTSLADTIRKVYDHNAANLATTDEQGFFEYERDGLHFMLIEAEKEDTIDLSMIRQELLNHLGRTTDSRIVEIIGDSGTAFHSHRQVLEVLLELAEMPNIVLEYGFTGSLHDTNWLVSHCLELKHEVGQRVQVIGNLVGQSIETLSTEGWSGSSHVTIFTLLCRRDGTLSSYGSDVWLSDGILNAASGDQVVCLEGGPQAFRQCVNALLSGVEVHAYTGLRRSIDKTFSAAKILGFLKDAENEGPVDLERYLQDYPPKNARTIAAIRGDVQRLLKNFPSKRGKLLNIY